MSETTRKTYRASQLGALYREIFALQRAAGWQDERDFREWYRSQGWRRAPVGGGLVGGDAMTYGACHRVNDTEVERLREVMQAGRWNSPIIVLPDGEIWDGRHRLTAAYEVDWANVPNDPEFVVVFGAEVRQR